MARQPVTKMAYASGEEMIFGTAKKPVTTKRGIVIGGGFVHPEVVPHPRPGSEKTMKTLLREYERANGDALERMVIVGHPTLQIENEHIFQMTHNPDVGRGNCGPDCPPDGRLPVEIRAQSLLSVHHR